MKILYILYLITNLGPSFKFEYSLVVAVYKSEKECNFKKDKLVLTEKYMRTECKPIDYYD